MELVVVVVVIVVGPWQSNVVLHYARTTGQANLNQ